MLESIAQASLRYSFFGHNIIRTRTLTFRDPIGTYSTPTRRGGNLCVTQIRKYSGKTFFRATVSVTAI